MFADNAEAAEIAYTRAELSQLDNQLDNVSIVSMESTDSGLVKHPALQKFRALAVTLRDDRFWQAFKTIANCRRPFRRYQVRRAGTAGY
jgi:hypothetical protein